MTTTKNAIKDVLSKFGQLGFIDQVLVTGTAEKTLFEAIDADKLVVIKAELKEPDTSLTGKFGIKTLPLINGLFKFDAYNQPDSEFSVSKQTMAGVEVISEFKFRDSNGQGSNFRLSDAKTTQNQPIINMIKWDTSFKPNAERIQEFAALASLYSHFDQYFSLSTKDNNLIATIGDAGVASHHVSTIIAENVSDEIKGNSNWKSAQFLSVLKLAAVDQATVSISNRGMLQVELETDFSKMRVVMPGAKR